MWPFDSSEDERETYYCDGQVSHDYEVLEETEIRYLDKYYDPQVDAEVVITATIPEVAECEVCGERIENNIQHWDSSQPWTSFKEYDMEFTKVIVNDCSDAERIECSEEFRPTTKEQ